MMESFEEYCARLEIPRDKWPEALGVWMRENFGWTGEMEEEPRPSEDERG